MITSSFLRSEDLGRRLIDLVIRLVVTHQLGAEDAHPTAGRRVLRELGHQRDVAVRQRRDDELLLQSRQAGDRVGPRRQPMPRAVQCVLLGLCQSGELVNRPGSCRGSCGAASSSLVHGSSPAAHAVHARAVAGAPRVGELRTRRPSRLCVSRAASTSRATEDRQSTTVPNVSKTRAFDGSGRRGAAAAACARVRLPSRSLRAADSRVNAHGLQKRSSRYRHACLQQCWLSRATHDIAMLCDALCGYILSNDQPAAGRRSKVTASAWSRWPSCITTRSQPPRPTASCGSCGSRPFRPRARRAATSPTR